MTTHDSPLVATFHENNQTAAKLLTEIHDDEELKSDGESAGAIIGIATTINKHIMNFIEGI
jgi:hypothetical protein